MQKNTSTRGNAIFYVLIGVVLFAALGYAFMHDWRSNFFISMTEQQRLDADEIIQYGNSLRPVIDQMILLGGAADNNSAGNGILFSASGASATYGAVGAQPATEIFNPSGGKIKYQTPPAVGCTAACAYEFTGQYTITGVGDNAKSELAMVVINVDPNVCQKINDTLGTGWSTIPTGAALSTLVRFTGSGTNTYTDLGGSTPLALSGVFTGMRAFCYRENSGAQRYIYLEVIRAR